MTGPRVSVVVPHYGDPAHALGLLDQLLAQHGLDAIEVVVVDDASPLPFPDVEDCHVTVVRRAVNGGFGAAVNDGAARATHPWLLVLNSDVRVEPDTVCRLVEATPQHTLAGPAVRTAGEVELTGRTFPTPRSVVLARVRVLQRFHTARWYQRAIGVDVQATAGRVSEVDWLAGVAMLLSTDDFRAVGGFDPSFFMYCEETDLQRRLAERGVSRLLVGVVEVGHLGGASSDPERTASWLTASQLHYARKWGGHTRTLTAMRAVALVNLGTNTLRRLAGRPVHPWDELVRELRETSG
jgi:N-acetylglucosaminyl-diphospho-decaprenol L-rhamnosyltransferase